MKPLRVFSLFDGISAGQVALERAGIPVEVYYASEIDKYAIRITQKNYPNTVQLGDVTKIDFTKFIGEIDLLIGGSPCQDLSIAGKRQGLIGERSGLFYKFVEALEIIKPKYFLLENNVGMPQEAYEEMSRLMGCYPIEINSALVSAQNRKRYYWTNIGKKNYNLFGFPTCAIPQPKDKRILLKDVLESGYGIAVENKGKQLNHIQNKSNCLLARDYKGFGNQQMTGVAEPICINGNDEIIHSIRLSEYDLGKGQGQRVYSVKGKSISLTSNGGGQGAKTGLYKIDLPDGDYIIRKLTPIECERLQTMAEVKNYVIIDFEEESITWFLERQKTNVQFVEEKCRKLLKLVGIAEKKDLNEFVQFAEKNLNINNLQTKELVALNVHINCEELSRANDSQRKLQKNVNIVEKNLQFHLQEKIVDFVQMIVGQNLIHKNTTFFGKEELHPREKNYIQVRCGKRELSKFGNEIMQLVKDVERNTLTNKKLMKYITLFHFTEKNIEQNLIIFYYFVLLVINGYTRKPISKKIIFEICNGYTKYGKNEKGEIVEISNTQRYKCIGNGWTVDVIAYIFSFLESE